MAEVYVLQQRRPADWEAPTLGVFTTLEKAQAAQEVDWAQLPDDDGSWYWWAADDDEDEGEWFIVPFVLDRVQEVKV